MLAVQDPRPVMAGIRSSGARSRRHGARRDPWTVETLGRAVGVSRSVLAARFAEMVGHPTMHYLTLWRMQLAARMLHDGRQVVEVADAVGYESEAAFSRTFKKLAGDAPTVWRRRTSSAQLQPAR
jgi:AraC-like DNA-binding protein